MQYSLYINQVLSVKWGLNQTQAILLGYLYEVPSWADEFIYEGKVYYSLAKSVLLDKLPLLFDQNKKRKRENNADTAYRIVKQLQEKGLVEWVCVKRKTYIRLTKEAKTWNQYRDKYKSELNPTSADQVGTNSDTSRNDVRHESDLNPTYTYTNKHTPLSVKKNKQKKNTPPKSETFKKLFEIYPAHRKGGTDAYAWKTWCSENLTEDDGLKAINWLEAAASNNPDWKTDARGQYVYAITKFIKERMWLTPIPAAPLSDKQSPFDTPEGWSAGIDEIF